MLRQGTPPSWHFSLNPYIFKVYSYGKASIGCRAGRELAAKRAERHDHARPRTTDRARPRTTDRARPRMTTNDRPRTHDRARPTTHDHARQRILKYTTTHDHARPRTTAHDRSKSTLYKDLDLKTPKKIYSLGFSWESHNHI